MVSKPIAFRQMGLLLALWLPVLLQGQSYLYRIEAITETGDFIFQDLDCGPTCDAIEAVTEGYDGYDFSHVGLVNKTDSGVYVGEAISAGVVWTPLSSFIERATYEEGVPQVLIMRLQEAHRKGIPSAIAYINERIGMSYDDIYRYGDDRYYCSELLFDAWEDQKEQFFSLTPMTFKQPNSEEFAEVWVNYFKELEQVIPEGEPGINPGSMSRSEALVPIFVSGLRQEK